MAQAAVRNSAITVLGGGITGLTSAWYLAQRVPASTKICLVEGAARLGGWMHSEHRTLGSGARVLAEKGPRTLRTGRSREATAVLELVDDLDLRDEVITAPKASAAARNRFVYYGGTLNCMPSGIGSLITGLPPAARCIPRAVWRDLTTRSTEGASDESVHAFITRRFGSEVDDNLVSAVMHGIYAADTRELSAKAMLYPMWLADHTGTTGVIRGLRRVAKISRAKHARFAARDAQEAQALAVRKQRNTEFWGSIADASMYSFRSGMQTLSDRIAADLAARPNVEVVGGSSVVGATLGTDGLAEVALADGSVVRTAHVVNTLPLHAMRAMFAGAPTTPLIESTPYASVAVANVTVGRANASPIDGFGYLVPRASAGSNPTLGIVLDSCALPQQDAGADVTRLTVILGGAQFAKSFGGDQGPATSLIEEMALDALRSQLGLADTPADIDVTMAKECIPTYTVGYVERLREMHSWVLERLGGRMSVVGAAYGGPSVPHCILHSRDLTTHSLDLDALVVGRPQNVSGLEDIVSMFD